MLGKRQKQCDYFHMNHFHEKNNFNILNALERFLSNFSK